MPLSLDPLASHQASADEYDNLPEPIKLGLTREDYAWLTDEQKATLVQQECDPEW